MALVHQIPKDYLLSTVGKFIVLDKIILGILGILVITGITIGQPTFAVTSAIGNAILEKYFNACYTTVNSVLAQQSDPITASVFKILLKTIPADKVSPSYKALVIQNMTQPIHVKQYSPLENTTLVDGRISQIAQCMVRLQH